MDEPEYCCACGGTYLACEENFNGYFRSGASPTGDEKRYGITARTAGYRWHEHDLAHRGSRPGNPPVTHSL